MRHYILTVLLLWSHVLLANDPLKFTSTVSKNPVGAGEQFEVSFTVNRNIESFSPPDFRGFQVLSGPNQSSSMTSINGATSMSMTLSYILVAERTGDFTIGAATIQASGKQLRSNTVKVKVVKGSAAPQVSQHRQSGQAESQNSNVDISKRLFIRAVTSKSKIYQGEQLSVSYKLYTNIELVDNALDKLPDFNGFWSQEIKSNDPNVRWETEVLNGTKYSVATLKEIILFPERSGKLTLDPLAMTFIARVPVATNDPFEMMFGGSYQDTKYKIKSQPVTINVMPLPEQGKPDGFQGAVGSFTLGAVVDRTELKANESLNYTLKISGTGNLKLLKAPELTLSADLEKYDPKLNDKIKETVSGVTGSREFTYLVIPRHEGAFEIPPFKFSYFNPTTEKYVILTADRFNLKIAKGAPGTNIAAYPGAQQDVRLLTKDIQYIKTGNPGLTSVGEDFNDSPLYYVLLGTGPVLFLFALGFRKWYREDKSDQIVVKSRNANKMAAKHLSIAHKQLALGDKPAFYEAVYRGLYGYLSDKLNIVAADLKQDNIIAQLKLKGIQADLLDRLTETIDLCEMARYAPVSGISEQEVYDKAKTIINEIDAHV